MGTIYPYDRLITIPKWHRACRVWKVTTEELWSFTGLVFVFDREDDRFTRPCLRRCPRGEFFLLADHLDNRQLFCYGGDGLVVFREDEKVLPSRLVVSHLRKSGHGASKGRRSVKSGT